MKWKSIQTKQVLLNILLHQQGQNNVITNQKTFDLHLWRAVTVFPKEQQIYQTEAKLFTYYSLPFPCYSLLLTCYSWLLTRYSLRFIGTALHYIHKVHIDIIQCSVN